MHFNHIVLKYKIGHPLFVTGHLQIITIKKYQDPLKLQRFSIFAQLLLVFEISWAYTRYI